MAGQGPNNTYNAGRVPGQAQMRREWDDMPNQPSDIHNQGQTTNFLQETGVQVKNMAQGAAEVGKGAAQGAVNLARGAALGAANVAQGAADAIKNTLGMNNPENTIIGSTTTAATNHPNSNTTMGSSTHSNSVNIDMDGSTYPNKPSYPHNPDARI